MDGKGSRLLYKSSTTKITIHQIILIIFLQFYWIRNSRVIPSALIACILQQAETIRIANLSTTNIRHSTLPGFGGDLPLKQITSFMISANENKTTKIGN